jgi:protease PrsW
MNALVALSPALLFLAGLWVMDTFKLVRPYAIALAIGCGGLAALVCAPLHAWLITSPASPIAPAVVIRDVAPLTEELAKAAFVAWLLARGGVGFLVDAAVLGFAIGTGFATVENVAYLRDLGDAPRMLWIVRGLGTGILHGATTAIVAMAGKALVDRRAVGPVAAILPGWAAAVLVHAAYNHALVSPVIATAILGVVLPVLVALVFERSERATREWVGAGLDLDIELLQLVTSDGFHATRFGTYLRELRAHFDGPVVADMFCLLRLELELAVQAKARLVARERGLELPVDDDLRLALEERESLRRSIGPTGLLALKPLEVTSHRDAWHRHVLWQAGLRDRWRRWLPFARR